jgi:tRNA dimethylallyltransferase
MIDTGLFDEIKDLRNHVVQGSIQMPGFELEKYQRGLWQAIGTYSIKIHSIILRA